jgi:hypothetical protein
MKTFFQIVGFPIRAAMGIMAIALMSVFSLVDTDIAGNYIGDCVSWVIYGHSL